MLGIRDILVRILIPIPGSSDPYLWLMDPDPISFFIGFKAAKKYFFPYFFLITCQQAHHLQSKTNNFLLKLFYSLILLNTSMRKEKDLDLDPYLWLIVPEPDREAQKHADPQYCWQKCYWFEDSSPSISDTSYSPLQSGIHLWLKDDSIRIHLFKPP